MVKGGKRLTSKSLWSNKPLAGKNSQNKGLIVPQENNGVPFLTFSFRYFGQQDFFGIGEQDAVWFANLFDRIKDLSGKTKAILENPTEREAYRFHPIDWSARNCPITISDLGSVPRKIKDNAEDDFFWQFQLSKGTGRVVGFFNEDLTIFYIVLLDPKHNIQPSQYYGYSVDDTEIAITDYERVQMCIADVVNKSLKCGYEKKDCPFSQVNEEYVRPGIFYACIDPDLKEMYKELIDSGEFHEKFEDFLLKEYCDNND